MVLNSTVTPAIEPSTTLRFRKSEASAAGVPGLSDALRLASEDQDAHTPDSQHRYCNDLALRYPPGLRRLPSTLSARLPAPQRVGISVPRGRHHRRMAVAQGLVLAAGAQRRRAEDSAQGHARRSSTFPAITTKAHASSAISRSATSTCEAKLSTRRSRASACGSIVHGDLFDGVIQHAKWLAYLGYTAPTR